MLILQYESFVQLLLLQFEKFLRNQKILEKTHKIAFIEDSVVSESMWFIKSFNISFS